MHWFMLLLLATLIAGGYYVYQRLLTIEREIREEQNLVSDQHEEHSFVETPPFDASTPEKAPIVTTTEEDLGVEILAFVALNPGLSQAEVYARFPDSDRRELQKRLRKFDQAGSVRREKEGSSYRLYPV
ncbi:hypothetical protein [Geopsychrobacter electrodiphilus]|uniref:hypothetical protein n=1 Tax=Geopsychrobacter electrodiphilus TaxID=225196 RepID=UPI00036D34D6|nr:hypothetical protein [Geopsychrobacter electrodiphilus]